MAILQSPEDLKNYCLRRLGSPVINIEIDDTQTYDRIDDAMQMFVQRHFDGVTEKYYLKVFNEADLARGYIEMDDNVVTVTDVDASSQDNSGEAFDNLEYQLRLNGAFDFREADLAGYCIGKQHISLIQDLLSPRRTFLFNRVTHQLRVVGNIDIGSYILIRVYEAIDPDYDTDVYNDEWLKKYATALIKYQWGSNVKKFSGVQMPGGVELDGQKIFDEAEEEVKILEEEFSVTYELPVDLAIG